MKKLFVLLLLAITATTVIAQTSSVAASSSSASSTSTASSASSSNAKGGSATVNTPLQLPGVAPLPGVTPTFTVPTVNVVTCLAYRPTHMTVAQAAACAGKGKKAKKDGDREIRILYADADLAGVFPTSLVTIKKGEVSAKTLCEAVYELANHGAEMVIITLYSIEEEGVTKGSGWGLGANGAGVGGSGGGGITLGYSRSKGRNFHEAWTTVQAMGVKPK